MAPSLRPRADRRRVEDMLVRFVDIPSVNPALDDGTGEAALANAVFAELKQAGFSPSRHRAAPAGRDNISVLLEGEPESPLLMWEAHIDTVVPSGKAQTRAVLDGGRVYGRGSCDTKGSLVAMIEGLLLLATGPRPRARVLFTTSIDEEVGGQGAVAIVADHPDIDMAVVGEPTDLEVAIAHKGVLRLQITTLGVPAHSSKPHLGVNAIHRMSKVLDALEHDYIPTLAAADHPLVGPPTISVSTIKGGTAENIVPASCTIVIDRRLNPGEDPDQVVAAIDLALEPLQRQGIELLRSPPAFIMAPLHTSPDHPLVGAMQRARAQVLGEPGQPIGVTYGTDASCFATAGIPCVVFGPGNIDHAHSDEEWVEVEDTALAAEILAALARDPGVARPLQPT